MTCAELIAFLAEYLEGRLDEKTRTLFEEHLGECPDCVTYLESYETTLDLVALSRMTEDAIAEEVPEDLVQAILAARRG